MKRALCGRLGQALVRDDDAGAAAVVAASLQQHVPSCPTCRPHQRTWELVRDNASAADDVLDDLTRARVFTRVQATLAAHAARAGGSQRRPGLTPTRLGWGLGFAAVTILAFVLGTRLRTPAPNLAGAPVALEPYALHPPVTPGAAVPAKGLDRLELPPRASMRARLGPAADLTLVGPLELTVRDSDKQRVELELGRGTLLGTFDGSHGRSLRISTPDATVDIVGTRFIVDSGATRTRVAVDHGLVRVESKGRARMVGAGQSWSTAEDALAPLDAGTTRMFERAARGEWEAPGATNAASQAKTPEEGATPPEVRTGRDDPQRSPPVERRVRQRATRVRHGGGPRGDADRVERAPPAPIGQARSDETAASSTARKPSSERRLALAGSPQRSGQTDHPAPPVPSIPSTARAPREEAPSAAAPSEVPPSAAMPSVVSPPASVPSPSPSPSPAPVVAPPPTAPAAARPTVSSLYKEAEQALGRGDDAAAKQRLATLVRAFPRDAMADSARFELALLAHKGGDQREALAQLREILGRSDRGPFVESARFLRCRVYLKEDRDAAETCLVRFVRDYPRSPHGEVAVQALIELARAKGQCGKAAQHAETYAQRYPTGRFADEAARVRSRCGP